MSEATTSKKALDIFKKYTKEMTKQKSIYLQSLRSEFEELEMKEYKTISNYLLVCKLLWMIWK